MKKYIIGSGFLKYANVLLFLSVITISWRFGLYKEVAVTALRPSSESLNTNHPFIFRWVQRPAGTIHALNRWCKVTTSKSDRFILESYWMFELKKCLSYLRSSSSFCALIVLSFPHRIYHLITLIWPPPSVSSSGLPYRLPDTVRPAAMLQHVLRPPQPSRETNPSVYRPLAPPSAAPAHHLPSSAPSHVPHDEFTAKEKEKLIKEEGDGVGRDSCTCP